MRVQTLDYGRNPGPNEKNKRSIHITGPQYIKALILFKIFSEEIVASKCGLLARIEKQAMS